MLKWAVGQRNPTPGQLVSSNYSSANGQGRSESSCFKTSRGRLHVAKRRNSRGVVRKAAVRSLKRIKQDKENQPCLVNNHQSNSAMILREKKTELKLDFNFQTPENVSSRTRDNSRLSQMALRDVSNSPDIYRTPRRHNYIKRRQSHPLNLITKRPNSEYSKSAPTNTLDYLKAYNPPEYKTILPYNIPQLPTTSQNTPNINEQQNDSYTDITDVVDMRKPNSTLKSLLTMQIEYSPGPLTATQSLMTLRQRLTKSLTLAANGMTPQGIDNPLYCALNPSEKHNNNGITISCNDQSPTPEGLMEEKSIFEQVSDKFEFINNLKKENSRIENTLVSSLSERLEWLRLNNSFNNPSLLKEQEKQKISLGDYEGSAWNEVEEHGIGRKRRDWNMLKRQKCVRRKIRKCCDGGCKNGNGSCCDKNKPKTQRRPNLMGLTLPLGENYAADVDSNPPNFKLHIYNYIN